MDRIIEFIKDVLMVKYLWINILIMISCCTKLKDKQPITMVHLMKSIKDLKIYIYWFEHVKQLVEDGYLNKTQV